MPKLEGYRFGRLVVNGEKQTREVIVLPERIVTRLLTDRRTPDSSRTTSKMSARASGALGHRY
jgi:hypothetical protein